MQLDGVLPIWLLIISLAALILWAIVKVKEPAGPFSMLALFAVFFMLGYPFRGIDLVSGGNHHLRRAFDINSPGFGGLLTISLLLGLVGFLAVVLGHAIGPSHGFFRRQLDEHSRRLFGERRAFWVVIAVFSALGGLGLALEVFRHVALEFYPQALINFAVVAALMLAIRWFTHPEEHRLTLGAWAILAVILTAWGVFGGQKVIFVSLALPIVLSYHFFRRRLRWPHLLAAILLLAAAFPFFYATRNVGFTSRLPDELKAYYDPAKIAAPFLGREYSADATMLAVEYIAKGHSYLYGSSFETLPSFFVPRAWWPDKPVSFALVFNHEVAVEGVFQPTTFLSPSITGELYLDGGALAVVLGCLVVGLFQRVVERTALGAGSPTPLGLALYSLLLVHMTQFVEGPIATHLEFAFIDIGTVVLALVIATVISLVARPVKTASISAVRTSSPGG